VRPRFPIALFFLCALSAGSQPASAEDLRIVAGAIPPYAFKTGGQADGAATLIVDSIAMEFGSPIQVEFQPWSRAQRTAQQGRNIGIIPLSRSPERETQYKWVGPLIHDREVLMTVSGNRKAPADLEEAKAWPICVLRGSPGEAKLRALGFSGLYAATDTAACAHRLVSGKVDAWSVAEMVAPYQFKLEGFDPTVLSKGAEVRANTIYLGLSKDVADDVVARWQDSLDRMRASGKLAVILKPFN